MLKLEITNDCLKFLRTLDAKQYRQVVTSLFNLLNNPEPHNSEAISGWPYRRVHVGEYRIIYRVDGEMLKAQIIGKRNDDDVYKSLRRLLG